MCMSVHPNWLDWFCSHQPRSLVDYEQENKGFNHCPELLSIWKWPITYLIGCVHNALCMHDIGSPITFSVPKLLSCKDGENTKKMDASISRKIGKPAFLSALNENRIWRKQVFKSLGETWLQGFSTHKLMIACHQDEFGWHFCLNASK